MIELQVGDCMDVLASLADESVDSIVCDPPYGLGFMGKTWDAAVPGLEWARECLRVLKPGGHLVAFGGSRTVHRLVCAVEDGGFEVRDLGLWLYWTGFPKNGDVSKAIDKLHGAERTVVGRRQRVDGTPRNYDDWTPRHAASGAYDQAYIGSSGYESAPATDDARRWDGWGTALKPAHEPWVLARKPPREKSIARQVLATGTGAIHVDACRYRVGDPAWPGPQDTSPKIHSRNGVEDGIGTFDRTAQATTQRDAQLLGRWPANVYACPKPPTKERERGCDGLPIWRAGELVDRVEGSAGTQSPRAGAGRASQGRRNPHPTVKPVRLMRWLVRLVTPPGGLVFDPFAGSGAVGIACALDGFDYLGAELSEDYARVAEARIEHAIESPDEWHDTDPRNLRRKPKKRSKLRTKRAASAQTSLPWGT